MRQIAVGLVIGIVAGLAIGLFVSVPQNVLSSKLLEWPLLLFLSITLGVVLFYHPLQNLLGRGDIRIKWGPDREIQLKDLARNIDKEIDPVAADLDQLRERVDELQRAVSGSWSQQSPSFGPSGPGSGRTSNIIVPSDSDMGTGEGGTGGGPYTGFEDDAWRIMRDAILASSHKWRRVSGLARLAGVSEIKP